MFGCHGPKQRLHQFKRQLMLFSASFRHLCWLRVKSAKVLCLMLSPSISLRPPPLPHLAGARVESPQANAVALASTLADLAVANPAPTSPLPIAPPAAPSAMPLQTLPSPSSPGQRFEIGEAVRVLARTTPGVRPTHATGILSATIVRIEGPNECLVRAGGADHANSRLVSDEVMLSLLPGMALAPIPSDRRVSWFIVIHKSRRVVTTQITTMLVCVPWAYMTLSKTGHESSHEYQWLQSTFSLTAPDDDFEQADDVSTF